MLLHDAFERTAQAVAAKTALVDGVRRVAYGDLLRQARALANALRRDGIEAGDRVLVFLESSTEYAVAVHAGLMIGGVIVPIHPLAKAERLAFIAADTRARALVTQAQLAPAWASVVPEAAHLASVRVAGLPGDSAAPRVAPWPGNDAPAPPVSSPCIDLDLAAIIYTSGTTGTPKGAMLTHRNMLSAWDSVQDYLGLRESDVIGLALPPAFSYGLYYLLMGLGLGATVVLERLAVFPLKLLESLERERVTVFPGVPSLFAAHARRERSFAFRPRFAPVADQRRRRAAGASPAATVRRVSARAAVLDVRNDGVQAHHLPPPGRPRDPADQRRSRHAEPGALAGR